MRVIDPSPLLRESDEVEWREYVTQFADEVWPIFSARGVAFGEAFMIWQLQRMYNRVSAIEDILLGERDSERDA